MSRELVWLIVVVVAIVILALIVIAAISRRRSKPFETRAIPADLVSTYESRIPEIEQMFVNQPREAVAAAKMLVAGPSSGIGEATALAFARRHARLAICARRLDRLQDVAERCRQAGAAAVSVRRADVGRRADARAFVAAALRDYDRIDVLVNN